MHRTSPHRWCRSGSLRGAVPLTSWAAYGAGGSVYGELVLHAVQAQRPKIPFTDLPQFVHSCSVISGSTLVL